MLSRVQGQAKAVKFLRLVIEGKLSEPLLLVGEEGVGRRFAVLETVKELFCDGVSEDDNFHTVQVNQKVHPDLVEVYSESGKEIGVDEIRGVIELATNSPGQAKKRVFLIDGADQMTPAAANAFLKTLEEPSPRTLFFLLAESASKVLPTIRSRCGLVRFNTLQEDFVLAKIREFESDPTKALVYSRLAEGSIGRAVQFYGAGRIVLRDQMFELLKLGVQRDLPATFGAVDSLEADLELGLRFLNHILSDTVLVANAPTKITNLDIASDLLDLRKRLKIGQVQRLRAGLDQIQARLRWKINLPFHIKACFVHAFAS
jgi:DNA polymerase-3 subunit delta'